MIKSIHISGFIFMLFSSVALAGTVVEIQNNNELTTVLTDGEQARINMSGSEYAIVDYQKQSVKVVSPEKQQVMLLNVKAMTAGKQSAPVVRTSVDRLGDGQPIAGYKTQKFGYSANGKSCGVIYGSWDAYEARGIKELLAAMRIMMEQQQAMLGGFAAMVDDCILADMMISDHVKTIGVPMRTEKNGQVDTEIKSINVDVALPADTFMIPASYKTVAMGEQVSALSNDMAEAKQPLQPYHPQTPPQMQPMMRQMQPPGQLSPAAMEQMRRAQGRMPRYQ
jgi:hypothetical protein